MFHDIAPRSADVFESINNTIISVVEQANAITIGILIAVVFICAIMMMLSEKARDKAKSWLGWVAVATILAVGAIQIANFYYDSIIF